MPDSIAVAKEKQGERTTRPLHFKAYAASPARSRTVYRQDANRMAALRTQQLSNHSTQRLFGHDFPPSTMQVESS
jgi:hypothetical protein